MLPHFDRVYSGNEYVQMLLKNSNIEVVKPTFLDREKYNATKIRSMIISEGSWENLVPSAVAEFIKKNDIKYRLQVINNSDTKPTEH